MLLTSQQPSLVFLASLLRPLTARPLIAVEPQLPMIMPLTNHQLIPRRNTVCFLRSDWIMHACPANDLPIPVCYWTFKNSCVPVLPRCLANDLLACLMLLFHRLWLAPARPKVLEDGVNALANQPMPSNYISLFYFTQVVIHPSDLTFSFHPCMAARWACPCCNRDPAKEETKQCVIAVLLDSCQLNRSLHVRAILVPPSCISLAGPSSQK
jgi:hypothetical protein